MDCKLPGKSDFVAKTRRVDIFNCGSGCTVNIRRQRQARLVDEMMTYHYLNHEWGREYEDWLAAEQAVYYREVIA